ncbi:Fanconi anemia group J protein homolog [Linepithema humile]|uniref:Fanconi anemia group J protein homolog n=1 Tax=Linepithema humile TaxID=83485 RepID=UPI000623123C|nr:PREDICTED: Fanconi anemia group J protein homolog [Linepithema humile]XP_012219997.1 PREDICTED: Fanconi anemia group J protein homolog [Linepithema humile]
MIEIYIVVAVIGTLIYALIKVTIDEWLKDLSMSQRWKLSLNRNRYNDTKVHVINEDPVEISDDESFDDLNIPKENENNPTNSLNNVPESLCTESSLKFTHDISDDSSDDKDSNNKDGTVNKVSLPNTYSKSPSLFNWNKTSMPGMSWYQNSTLAETEATTSHNSRHVEEIFEETSNKRQKLMIDVTESSSDDDLAVLDTFKKEALPQVVKHYEIMIAATKVKFPVEPYKPQKAVMDKVIRGCNKEENCILESPTGSGKTLALLCGALAWQEQYSEKVHRESVDEINPGTSCCGNDDNDGNFFLNSSQYFDEEWRDKVLRKTKAAQHIPKVYYGTRTHKQIEQVVRELKKTAYRYKRMTILSARIHTCIQDTDRNKNDLCNELLDPLKPKKCPYYTELNKKPTLFSNLETPWDIEDLVSMGRAHKACPYFGARALKTEAEIIFCPYNYIVDPHIRESMQISLKGNIVILDEAHNIEDFCRDAASVNLKDSDLTNAADDCMLLSKKRPEYYKTYLTIHTYLTDIVKFLQDVGLKDNSNAWEMVSDCWSGTEFVELLNIKKIGRARFPDFFAASKAIIRDYEIMYEITRAGQPTTLKPTISHETKKILEYLYFVLEKIESDMFVDDYRVYVIEMEAVTKKIVPDNVWISKEKNKNRVRIMKLICMNPAVTFVPLARTARSVILASGTLTPTSSFEGELGTRFPQKLDADHIISKDQVYVRCIPKGPTKKILKATYENVNTFTFQDELGELILQVCDAVPYGVLCFFASYTLMNTLRNRWMNNGIWEKLLKLKKIFTEPKESQKLPSVMEAYRNTIKESSSKSFREASGAILFAVFRGKVAEGIDFSDNEARCVLAIGIPYMNSSNVDILMKKEYNDSNKSTKGLLSGREWYNVNAFRALNQAIGRCIRHKNDWGAVLLVDQRFQLSQNIHYLPKWVKTMWMHNENYDLQTELEDFVAIQVAREKGEQYLKEKKEKTSKD